MKQFYYAIISSTLLIFISTNAHAQWTSNTSLNTPICIATGTQRDPRIEDDDKGGAFILWKDYRTGVPDVYVQLVDSNGIPQWASNGLGACIQAADQSTPSFIKDDRGGIIVTWSDWRSGIERDLYAQRIDGNGNLLWATDGAIISNKVEREHNQRVVTDGAAGCIVAWEQQNQSTWLWEIWAQRLDSNGVAVWPAGGMPVVTVSSNKRNPKLQSDGYGGAYIVWQDLRNGTEYDIYAQHLTGNGTRLFGTSGLAICAATNDQTNPKIDPDKTNGGAYFAWADQRNGATNNDIYAQRIDSLGNFMWNTDGVPVCMSPNGQSAVDILSNTNVNGLILTWKDKRSGTQEDIYAQRLNPNGIPQWTTNGVPIEANTYPQINPNICGDGVGGAIIVWQDSTSGSISDIKAQRLNSMGNKVWASNNVVVSNATGSQVGPKNTTDKKGGTIVVWEDIRTGLRDIYIQHIYHDGYQVGLNENSNIESVEVFPNPFIDQLNISFNSVNPQVDVSMLNLLGADMTSFYSASVITTGNHHEIKMDVQQIPAGVYFISIHSGSSHHALKVIKE